MKLRLIPSSVLSLLFPLVLGTACEPMPDSPPDVQVQGLKVIPNVERAQTPEAALEQVMAEGFMLGTNWSGSSTAAWSNELGLKWSRGTVSFRSVMPELYDDTLTMEEVDNNPALLDWFMENADWRWADSHLRGLIDAGISPFPVIGLGWIGCLPTINGETATPDRLGSDTYLAYLYLYARAVVERYDGDGDRDASGIHIKLWQIENELNQAMFTTLYGWREPTGVDGLTSLWADQDFLFDVLFTLNRAVHQADPSAITTHNFHTDVPPEYNHFFKQPGWPESARLWRDLMDVIGFDAYPNYYYADPLRIDAITERINILKQAGGGKPIIIMESGYPAGPLETGFSPEKQAQYLDQAVHAAIDGGAIGYFHFKLSSSYTHSVEITDEDQANLEQIGHWFEEGRVLLLLGWVAQNADEIPHTIEVLQSVEGYWGLIDDAGNRQPSFYTMQDLAAAVE